MELSDKTARQIWDDVKANPNRARFGFGKNTGSGFPGESAGRLQPPERWRPVEIATMSYGYGLTTTALQLAQGYATLASGGIARPA